MKLKITIDPRIVAGYNSLPDTFVAKAVMKDLGFDPFNNSERILFYENLKRMVQLGILGRNSSDKYMKKYPSTREKHGLIIWFNEYLPAFIKDYEKQKLKMKEKEKQTVANTVES